VIAIAEQHHVACGDGRATDRLDPLRRTDADRHAERHVRCLACRRRAAIPHVLMAVDVLQSYPAPIGGTRDRPRSVRYHLATIDDAGDWVTVVPVYAYGQVSRVLSLEARRQIERSQPVGRSLGAAAPKDRVRGRAQEGPRHADHHRARVVCSRRFLLP
jgi:hypothetical protein